MTRGSCRNRLAAVVVMGWATLAALGAVVWPAQANDAPSPMQKAETGNTQPPPQRQASANRRTQSPTEKTPGETTENTSEKAARKSDAGGVATPDDATGAPSSKEPARPAWVDAPADYSGPIHRIPVGSGPYATPQQARQALDQALQQQLAQYVADQLGDEQAAKSLVYPAATIRQRWVPPDGLFEDTVDSSVGPMHRAFARLELGPELRRELERLWRRLQSRQRLVELGAAAGAVLGLLACVHLALGAVLHRRSWSARGDARAPGERQGWLQRPPWATIVAAAGLLGVAVAVGTAWWLAMPAKASPSMRGAGDRAAAPRPSLPK